MFQEEICASREQRRCSLGASHEDRVGILRQIIDREALRDPGKKSSQLPGLWGPERAGIETHQFVSFPHQSLEYVLLQDIHVQSVLEHVLDGLVELVEAPIPHRVERDVDQESQADVVHAEQHRYPLHHVYHPLDPGVILEISEAAERETEDQVSHDVEGGVVEEPVEKLR